MIHIWTDGGSRGNPGHAGIGVYAAEGTHTQVPVFTIAEYIGTATNNFAEYTAVIRALETCKEKKYTKESLAFFLDSKLVVEQVQGHWKVKEQTLVPLVERVRALSSEYPQVTFTYIPREQNARADALANEAMDAGMQRV
jgi:ribonuclease H / adenosylcobalamin/alpha-ribazole phosphatase